LSNEKDMTWQNIHDKKGTMQEKRKLDHIEMALKAQSPKTQVDHRFNYEPLFSSHPDENTDLSLNFLGKKMNAPIWISSMTGGVGPARYINQNLARLCSEFGLGMGLGSCRTLLNDQTYFEDFNLRPIIGDHLPFYANLGIAQIEQITLSKTFSVVEELITKLKADGLIIHINPMQEFFQPEGDRIKIAPLETLKNFTSNVSFKVIVKEVGHGFGPASLKALLELPIAGIELGAFGGTNFSILELQRQDKSKNKNHSLNQMAFIGHTADEMISMLNEIKNINPNLSPKDIIISGGVANSLDGHYLKQNLNMNSVIGFAKNFLLHAEDYDQLREFFLEEISALKLANCFLRPKDRESFV
jgi:isopentenyl-diphosphate delta-isomerase